MRLGAHFIGLAAGAAAFCSAAIGMAQGEVRN